MSSSLSPEEKPYVVVTNSTTASLMSTVMRHIVEGQKTKPRLFQQRGGVLVRLRDEGRGEVEVLNQDALQLELDRAITFRIPSRDTYMVTNPPTVLVRGILAADRYPDVPELPELRRLAEVPYFTADGQLITSPGYHAGSRTFLRLPSALWGMADLPAKPTYKDVEQAKRLLVDELLHDFPFTSPSSRSHVLALLITPFVREIIGTGPVPMAAIVAPAVGSGKTLIAQCCALITTGKNAVIMAAIDDRTEVEKRITSLLLAAAPYGVFDNAVDRIDSPILAALLTSDTWSGRVLGKSKMVELPNQTQWLITGNRLTFTDEIARRALTIALDPKTDKPNLRGGFKHDPLLSWIKAERPALVRAVLVLVQHWLASNRPAFTARVLGSFESYVKVVGGILMAAGLDEGFITATVAEDSFSLNVQDADADLHRLVKDWYRTYGYTIVDAGKLTDCAPKALLTDSKVPRIALGMFVKKQEGRTIGGYRIHPAPYKDENYRMRNAWKLVDVASEAREAWP